MYYTLKTLYGSQLNIFRNIWLIWLSQSKKFLTPDIDKEISLPDVSVTTMAVMFE